MTFVLVSALPKIVSKANSGLKTDVNVFVKTLINAYSELNGINKGANAAALQLTPMNAQIEQFITSLKAKLFLLYVILTGTKTLVSANAFLLTVRLMQPMVPIQTTLARTSNGDLISMVAFASRCIHIALQASIGMKTLVNAIALLVVAQSASTGPATSACVSVTLSLANQDTTSLRPDANAFFIHKTVTLPQTPNLILH